MEILLEQNLDELFDLNPLLAEIYSNYSADVDDDDQQKMSCLQQIDSWDDGQEKETISLPISSSSSSSVNVAAVEAPPPPPPPPPSHELISFENGRRLISSTNINTNLVTSQIISFSPSAAKADQTARVSSSAPTPTRTPLQAQDHVMAERKRRENLSQLFIALSKLVPGLKKLDKASLLEDAINYLKALQERVSALEKLEEEDSSYELAPREISVRIWEKHVLIKIWCKKQMGLMSRIPCELERIHLSVIDMRIMPFGGGALDVTILAQMQMQMQMQSEFIDTMKKEIVDHLKAVLGHADHTNLIN